MEEIKEMRMLGKEMRMLGLASDQELREITAFIFMLLNNDRDVLVERTGDFDIIMRAIPRRGYPTATEVK